MASDDGTFGFEDLQKAFNRIESKYENKTDAMLMSLTNVARSRIRSKTPAGKSKKLRGSWRTRKPKTYGKTRVARVQSDNRYAHVVEEGHQVVTGGSSIGKNGRRLNLVQRNIRGIKSGGRTEGKKMIEDSMKELESTFNKSAEKLLNDLTSEVEL